ncbi:MAG: DnaB-like helicase C-terminal domain-containing protein [Bacteroidaceae bacterium]
MKWYEAKLVPELFKGAESGLYMTFVRHLEKYNKLPQLETLFENFADLKQIPIPESAQFYLDGLEERYKYDTINDANVESQTILAEDKTKVDEAFNVMMAAGTKIQQRGIGKRVISFRNDAPKIILSEYHDTTFDKSVMRFHWDYLDFTTKGASGGDVVGIVGRPQAGKSWLMINNAYKNFSENAKSSLFVSMEMNHLAMSQRFSVLHTTTPITGLKTKQYSSIMYNRFKESLVTLPNTGNGADIFIVDGNLAADVEDIYMLAQQLGVNAVYIDGAYLCRTKNGRLGRYERVTEVAECTKRYTTSLNIPTFSSWQFNREAVAKKGGRGEPTEAGLENIGMTDAIGQLSSVVLGLMQQKSVETLNSRTIDILKGRDGETGKFKIHWDFINMNFSEYNEEKENGALLHI